ncbi:hypothetical protein ACPUVO_10320 [Pseudocolwellia sp. HL-MZ19]|uniref:hypothetical protein n=1 Tax=unclassified Pseudocolwellia TaxID=2848178 RepID=UPI003CF37B7D
MRKLLPILIFSFIYSASAADIYTCEIDGTTTFSQIPCGDSDQKVEVGEPQSFQSNEQRSNNNSDTPQNSTQSFIDTNKRNRIIKKLETLVKQRDEKLNELEAKFLAVSHNRAGYLHQNEISKEVVSTNNKYKKLIDAQERKLEALQNSRN